MSSDVSYCKIEGNKFVCKNCGDVQSFPEFPLEISKLTDIMENFVKQHENCKLVEVPSSELDMFAKYGVKIITKGNTTIKLVEVIKTKK